MVSLAKKILCLAFVLTVVSLAETENSTDIHDNSRIALFLQPGISFLSFDQREYFQDAIDTIHHEFLTQALDKRDSANVAKQDFQKVNFCFPIYAGLQFQLRQDHFVSIGAGYIHDNESVVLVDQNNRSHNYSYTIQGIPLFLEYRFAIPVNLMTLSNESLFSIALRWYWALPHTEIYTSWGKLAAETPFYGSGFGLSIGYLLFNWKSLYIYGDLGYSYISVKSKKQYADIVPDGPEEKAKWNIGGIQLQIRISFGAWNKPVVIEDSTATTDSTATGSPEINSATVAKDSSSIAGKDSATADSAGVKTATVAKDSSAADKEGATIVTKDSAAAPSSAEKQAPAPEATKPEASPATKPE
jgi:hypothetical protein